MIESIDKILQVIPEVNGCKTNGTHDNANNKWDDKQADECSARGVTQKFIDALTHDIFLWLAMIETLN